MAQSIGVCPTQTLYFTPFRDLFTYLNVPDSIGRESLFEAEVNRCYEYLKKCEKLRGFSFGIIDELFTGTNPPEGMAGSYAILNQIARNPVNITVISTHFHDMLKELDRSYFTFKRFACDTMVDMFGRTQHRFDYQIRDGVSDQMIALDLLEERGFDEQTIMNAHRFIRKLRQNKNSNTTKRVRFNTDSEKKKDDIEDIGNEQETYLIEKVAKLMDDIDIQEIDDDDDIEEAENESDRDHIASQHARALEYSKQYNVMNGLPPVLRR